MNTIQPPDNHIAQLFQHKAALLFMNGGLGNGVILAPMLKDLEEAFPNLVYYAPQNGMLTQPWVTESLQFTGPQMVLPDVWRRFLPVDHDAIFEFASHVGATLVINLRKEAAEQDGNYFQFRHRAAAAHIECWDLHELQQPILGLPIGAQAAELLRMHNVPGRQRQRSWASGRYRPRRGVIGLCVGASAQGKRWPAADWSVVVSELLRQRWQVEIASGTSDEERAIARLVTEEYPDEIRVRLPTAPAQWHDWVTGLYALISNDTLAVHVAAALGCPTVALYLSTNGSIWAPLAEPRMLCAVQSRSALDCEAMKVDGTCRNFYSQCHTSCGKDITPKKVLHGFSQVVDPLD